MGPVNVNGRSTGIPSGLQVKEIVTDHDEFAWRRLPLYRKAKKTFRVRFGRDITPSEDALFRKKGTYSETLKGLEGGVPGIAGQDTKPGAPLVQGADELSQPRSRLDPFQKSGLDLVEFVVQRLGLNLGERRQIAEDIGPLGNSKGMPDDREVMYRKREGAVQVKDSVLAQQDCFRISGNNHGVPSIELRVSGFNHYPPYANHSFRQSKPYVRGLSSKHNFVEMFKNI